MTDELLAHFRNRLLKRRSTRRFKSDLAVPLNLITSAIEIAHSGPSGANRQPWHFVVVSNPDLKAKIRDLSEIEEKELYSSRASESFLEALKPIGTNWEKPHLTEASHLIVVFSLSHSQVGTKKIANYYVKESAGIAVGLLLSALAVSGVDTLTHTPRPMKFLNSIFGLDESYQPYMILALGYAHEDYKPPALTKRALSESVSLF